VTSATIDRWALVSGPALKRMPWVALAPTVALCSAVVWTQALAIDERLDLLPTVRIAVVLIAAAAATCLDDPNEPLVDSTPVGRFRRRCLSVAMTGLVSMFAAGALLAGAALVSRDAAGSPLPVGGVLIELAATCAFGWMIGAGLVAGTTWRNSGVRAAIGVVVAAPFSLAHPHLVGWLWASPGPGWRRSHECWSIVGIVSIVMFLLFSRDAATRWGLSRRDTT
jgi:hypothetical protein